MNVAAPPPRRSLARVVSAAASGDDAATTAESPRILIVEDEYLVALELEIGLAEAGFDVVGTASTATEAVRLAKTESPALVVMDVRLAGRRDGIDAAISIYGATGIRCIFATAYAEPQLRQRADAAAPLAWLAKPYQVDALIRVIRTALRDLQQQ
jgi:DNA-binding NarL/FixJ family response regulator